MATAPEATVRAAAEAIAAAACQQAAGPPHTTLGKHAPHPAVCGRLRILRPERACIIPRLFILKDQS